MGCENVGGVGIPHHTPYRTWEEVPRPYTLYTIQGVPIVAHSFLVVQA
jgi:hypothetical protein